MANDNPLIRYNIGVQTPGTAPKIVVPEEIKKQIVLDEKKKKKVSLLDILSGAGTVVGNFLGAKQATKEQMMQYPNGYYEPQKDNTIWIVLVVLIIVILAALLFIKKDK